MTREEVFIKVVDICKDVFENEEIMLTDASKAENVEEWDSITHLNLISDIEDEFGISFTLEEMTASKMFGELVNIVWRYVKGA